MDDFYSGVQVLLSLVALILSICVTYIVIRQTRQLHRTSHDVAVEEFQRVRFDGVFGAVEKVLLSISDLKADLMPYWKETPESLEAKERSGEMLPFEINVHRAIEHLNANRKVLEVALVGLPTVAASDSSDDTLAESRTRLLLAASWLGGCVMAA